MWNSGCHFPCGRRPPTAPSGTKKSEITTSFDPVPRIPITRQVGSIRTASERIGTPKCSTVGPASGSS